MKNARLFLRAFFEVLSFILGLAACFMFMVLGGTLFGIEGFLGFGFIEFVFLVVLARYDELKRYRA